MSKVGGQTAERFALPMLDTDCRQWGKPEVRLGIGALGTRLGTSHFRGPKSEKNSQNDFF